MGRICGIQNAIDDIGKHLTDKIDYEKVAKQSFSSSYHFQRIFGILCGYTLGENIRLEGYANVFCLIPQVTLLAPNILCVT